MSTLVKRRKRRLCTDRRALLAKQKFCPPSSYDGLPLRTLRDAKFGRSTRSRFYDDLYIVPQGDQETHEALDRISPEPTRQHGRDLGLIDAHELCCRLGELSLGGWSGRSESPAPALIRCSPAPGPRSANTLPVLGSCLRASLFGILHLTSQAFEPLPDEFHLRLRCRGGGFRWRHRPRSLSPGRQARAAAWP